MGTEGRQKTGLEVRRCSDRSQTGKHEGWGIIYTVEKEKSGKYREVGRGKISLKLNLFT